MEQHCLIFFTWLKNFVITSAEVIDGVDEYKLEKLDIIPYAIQYRYVLLHLSYHFISKYISSGKKNT